MTAETIYYVALGAACGGAINGLAGFGTALFAIGFFLTVATPVQAVAVLVVLSSVTGAQGLWVVRRAVGRNVPRLLRFVIPGLFGIPIGVEVLSLIDAKTLKLFVAGFLILYGGYFTLRRSLPKFERRTPVADGAVGFAGGVLGGAAGLSGALPTMWCSCREKLSESWMLCSQVAPATNAAPGMPTPGGNRMPLVAVRSSSRNGSPA